jgi:putative methanogenesis marker protein 8
MDRRDIHVLKYFSSYVSVSDGKVINITDPTLTYCPLAEHLYKDFRGKSHSDKDAIKNVIKMAIESKIKDYGFFTDERKILFNDVAIPYGASEMISFSLRKKVIDAAVVVCDGAGTVITDKPKIVQGIGARMNSLLMTSPVKGIIKKLKSFGCQVVFENALIDQARGVQEAVRAGYKTIVVSVCGHSAENLKAIRSIEKEYDVSVITLAVCTTGITKDKINIIRDHADLVWSCASSDVRRIIGSLAILQLSRQIPVFVLTEKGLDFVAAYSRNKEIIDDLDSKKQYLASNEPSGQPVYLGNFKVFIRECKLPVNARKEPIFEDKNEYASV